MNSYKQWHLPIYLLAAQFPWSAAIYCNIAHCSMEFFLADMNSDGQSFWQPCRIKWRWLFIMQNATYYVTYMKKHKKGERLGGKKDHNNAFEQMWWKMQSIVWLGAVLVSPFVCPLWSSDQRHSNTVLDNTLWKQKVLPKAPFLVLQLVTNRELVSVPGRTNQCPEEPQ